MNKRTYCIRCEEKEFMSDPNALVMYCGECKEQDKPMEDHSKCEKCKKIIYSGVTVDGKDYCIECVDTWE